MKQTLLIILIEALFLISCSNNKSATLQTVEIDGRTVPVLIFNDVRDTIKLYLSELLDDVSYIKLETTADNKLTRGKWSVGKKYIIGYCSKQGIFQFSSNGDFIRKLAEYGKGPQEVFMPTWTISENEKIIVISDMLKPKSFMCLNLDSGQYIRSIPIAREGNFRNISFVNDSTIACAPIGGNGNPDEYCLFWQNLSGKLIYGIRSRDISKPIYPNENLLYKVGDKFHYKPIYGDTIFSVNGFTFEPYFIFKANGTANTTPDIGETTIEVFADAASFLIFQVSTTTNKRIEGGTTFFESKQKYYYVDLFNKRPYLIAEFYNDLSGERENPVFFQNQTSDLKYISYEAISYLRRIDALKKDPGIKILNREKFIKPGDGLTEDDNPILLTGKFSN